MMCVLLLRQEEEEDANGRGSPRSDDMDAFTLHDIDDDEPETHAGAAHPSSAAAAPAVDPKAEAPKAQLLKGVPKSDAPSQ